MEQKKDKICFSGLLCVIKYEQGYNVTSYNGVDMGTLEVDVDGYYKYWPTNRIGYWEASLLRAIADLLDYVNAEWDAQVQRDCGV